MSSQTSSKNLAFKEENNSSFFNKKRLFLLFGCFAITIAIVVLAIVTVLKIDVKELFRIMGQATSQKLGLLFALIILMIFRTLMNCVPYIVRMKQLGYKASFGQTILYCFSYAFLSMISPANLLYDPYNVFWMKTQGVSNKEAYCIMTTNGLIYQVSQILVTIPSFAYITSRYFVDFMNDSECKYVYWLTIIGLIIDLFVIAFFFIISFSKRISFFLSVLFNKVKKLFHLKYHTLEETKKTYIEEAQARQESLKLMRGWKFTSIVFLWGLIVEFTTYAWVYLSIQWLVMPKDITLSFWAIFNCANTAITANKMIPLPGNAISLEWSLSRVLSLCGNIPDTVESKTDDLINQSILVYRFFSSYLPGAIGMVTFVWWGVLQIKKISSKSKGPKIPKKYLRPY